MFLKVLARVGEIWYNYIVRMKSDTPPTLKMLTISQDFCFNPRKRRRRAPLGALGGADDGLEQKDKEATTFLELEEYRLGDVRIWLMD